MMKCCMYGDANALEMPGASREEVKVFVAQNGVVLEKDFLL